MDNEATLRWQPKDHPANRLPADIVEAAGRAFNQIPTSDPTEMYRVQMERHEPMVYMPYQALNRIIWELAEELAGLKGDG